MAATLASLWEKKKKVQANRVDLTLNEDLAQTVPPSSQTDVSDTLSEHCQITATVSSSKQSQGQDKKRKRAQVAEPSSQQIQILTKLRDGSQQPSAEDTKYAAKSAAVSEQLLMHWSDEQHDTQAKRANVEPLSAKPAASVQHGAEGSASLAQAQASKALRHDDHTNSAARPAQVNSTKENIGPAQQLSEARGDPTAAAQLTHTIRGASPKQGQSTSKQHLLEHHQHELEQCMQQAQAVQPLADLPAFTDRQFNRPEVTYMSVCTQHLCMYACHRRI